MQGVLRGFDPFMNLVVDEAVEQCKTGERNNIGMVVGPHELQTANSKVYVPLAMPWYYSLLHHIYLLSLSHSSVCVTFVCAAGGSR